MKIQHPVDATLTFEEIKDNKFRCAIRTTHSTWFMATWLPSLKVFQCHDFTQATLRESDVETLVILEDLHTSESCGKLLV